MDLSKAAAAFANRTAENSVCLRTGAAGGSIGRDMTNTISAPKMEVGIAAPALT